MELIERFARRLGIETKAVLRKTIEDLTRDLHVEITLKELLESNLKSTLTDLDHLKVKVKESDELSEFCLREQKITEEEYKRYREFVEGEYGSLVVHLYGLPKRERQSVIELIPSFVPRSRSDKSPKEKIKYNPQHHNPEGLKNFLNVVARCPFVDRICAGGLTRKGVKKTTFNEIVDEEGTFIINGFYVVKNLGEAIFVYTTAGKWNEAFFIRHLLNRHYR